MTAVLKWCDPCVDLLSHNSRCVMLCNLWMVEMQTWQPVQQTDITVQSRHYTTRDHEGLDYICTGFLCLHILPIWHWRQYTLYMHFQMVLTWGIILICWSNIASKSHESRTTSTSSIVMTVTLRRVTIGLGSWMSLMCCLGATKNSSALAIIQHELASSQPGSYIWCTRFFIFENIS